MKARVKATGEIFDFEKTLCSHTDGRKEYLWTSSETDYVFRDGELDFCIKRNTKHAPDYWTKLEHQYAGMFMRSFLDNFDGTASMEQLTESAIDLARAFIQKLKGKEARK